jgi:hypothetical protein
MPNDRMPFARLILAVINPETPTTQAEQRLAAWLREHTAPA